MRDRAVVISLQRRREHKELAKVYDCIHRLVSVPDYLIEHEPGLVTGLADGDGDQTEAIGRLVQAADVWTWV